MCTYNGDGKSTVHEVRGKYTFRGKYEILRKVHAKYTFFLQIEFNCL